MEKDNIPLEKLDKIQRYLPDGLTEKILGRPPGSKDGRKHRKQPTPRYPIWWN